MSNRFRPLLMTLLASALTMPVASFAQELTAPNPQVDVTAPAPKVETTHKKTHHKAAPKTTTDTNTLYVANHSEVLDPAADPSTQVDVDADMTAGTAQDQPLSMFEAMRYAYDHSNTIRAARQELMAVEENLPQAQSGWKPSAGANAGVTKSWIDSSPSSSTDGSVEKDIGLSVNQPLYRGGRTVSGIANAKNIIMAQRAALNATESQVLLGVVTSYMNVLRDQSLLDLAVNNRDVIAKQLDAVNARFNVGDVTRTDVSQAKARLAGAESSIISARGDLQSSRAVYQQVVGIPAGRLGMPKQVMPIPDTLDQSIGMATTYNPNVVAAQFTRDAAKDNVDVIHGELLPTVGLNAGVTKAYDPTPGLLHDETIKSIGISATVPLYEAGSVRSRVRQAKSTASQRGIEVDRAKDDVRQLTVSSWETLQATTAEIDSRKEQVKANAIARDGVHKEAELGTRTILDALNADQELLTSQSALVTARRDEVVARYTLAAALGLMNPNAVGFPELSRDYNDHIREITAKIFSTSTDYSPDVSKSRQTVAAQKPVNR
jgi:outer membrane protein